MSPAMELRKKFWIVEDIEAAKKLYWILWAFNLSPKLSLISKRCQINSSTASYHIAPVPLVTSQNSRYAPNVDASRHFSQLGVIFLSPLDQVSPYFLPLRLKTVLMLMHLSNNFTLSVPPIQGLLGLKPFFKYLYDNLLREQKYKIFTWSVK